MAQLYTIEPQTNAKVILSTSFGPLELELWGRECPLTVKNFLQLCYNSYYSNTILHRLIPGFILQGGDPTGTGHGGEAIYPGGLFADEFHPRLRFNRRGLLGMANGGEKDDNGSQFFFTLGEERDLKQLNGKNTVFGKVVGESLYNLVRMGEVGTEEVGGSERPAIEIRITGTEVVVNPWPEEIRPKDVKRKTEVLEKQEKRPTAKKKKKGKQMLSFADAEEEEEFAPVRKKPKFDTRLVVDAQPVTPPLALKRSPSPSPPHHSPSPKEQTPPPPPKSKSEQPVKARAPAPSSPPLSKLEKTERQIAELKRSLRRASPPAATSASVAPGKKKSLLAIQKSLLPSTSVQGRRKSRKKHKALAEEDDDDAYDALQRFKAMLSSAAAAEPEDKKRGGNKEEEDDEEMKECDLHFIPGCESCKRWDVGGEEDEDGEDGGAEGLWGHTLSFEKDRKGKDLMWKKKNEELVVIDPREKEREIVKGRRGRDRDRDRIGDRGREGDRGRDRERGGR